MKVLIRSTIILLGVFFLIPETFARGARGGGGSRGGGARSAKVSRQPARRSPMTNSRMQRPKSRPTARPASRPSTKPTRRPSTSRPSAKPATRPSASRPSAKPATRPSASRPSAKPATRPSISKPTTKPATRPSVTKPANRPGQGIGNNRPGQGIGNNRPGQGIGNNRPGQGIGSNRPGQGIGSNRPGQGIGSNRPGQGIGNNRPGQGIGNNRPGQGIGNNRPATLPGMVSYPNKPKIGNKNKIGNNRGNTYINNVNVGRRNNGLNRPATLPANKRNWNSNKWGGNRGVWGNNNNINIKVNNNFRNNNNFAYRPNYWGGRPWWGAGGSHSWHHGHWGYGWNSSYYRRHWYYNDNDFAKGFMWGIGVWSLGNMIYDMGYKSYKNPYPAPPVENTYINYAEPVSVAAAANPPGDDSSAELADTKSDEALDRSRIAFRKGDYVTASKAIDEALGHTPDDVTLHEFRALVFFALNKYSDATGVLNAVLASGPGWSWDTMIGFYESSSVYSDQLRKLEDYVNGSPDKADSHFLLGYHYMVCGEMEKSHDEFKRTAELQPADTIASQLAELTLSSIPDNGSGGEDATPPPAPDPVPLDKLVGTWVNKSSGGGTITFTMKETGDYTWDYKEGENDTKLTGTYGLNDKGLLVLTSDDTQMVSEVKLADDSKMHFTIIGSPDGDPGIDFKKG